MIEAAKEEHVRPKPSERKAYVAPRLQCFGNVRDLTLGASQGFGESTGAGIRKGGPGS